MNKDDYLEEMKRFSEYANYYKSVLACCHYEMKNKITRVEKSVGGLDLFRGYYCPSIIEDIVIGNVSRGKILKKITGKSKPNFTFCFDSNNNLVMVKGYYREIIFKKGNHELGIEFKKGYKIRSINECIYENGKIKSITRVFFDVFNRGKSEASEYKKEVYHYKRDRLIVEYFECEKFFLASDWSIHQTKFNFFTKNGYLKNYTIQEAFGCGEYGCESYMYKVYKKRELK